jgi:hypothetical protein
MRRLISSRLPPAPQGADRYLGLASAVAGVLGIIALSTALLALGG